MRSVRWRRFRGAMPSRVTPTAGRSHRRGSSSEVSSSSFCCTTAASTPRPSRSSERLLQLLVAHEEHQPDFVLSRSANHLARIVERFARHPGFTKDEHRVHLWDHYLEIAIPVAGRVPHRPGPSHQRKESAVLDRGPAHRVRVTAFPVERVQHKKGLAYRGNFLRIERIDVNARHAGCRLS